MRTLPQLKEEEWALDGDSSDQSGFGSLESSSGPLPLKAMDVRSRLEGTIAEVELTQTFVNTHDEHIEATYIFPLPDRAAVCEFQFRVADRVVDGVLKERGQARREYRKAIETGHRAALSEEDRPGVFTIQVGNLPPGESATVSLTFVGPVAVDRGEATFRFPLVVAPRYIPGRPLSGSSVGSGTSPDTDAVPDASRITPSVLLPGYPNPVQLSLSVEFPCSEAMPGDVRSSLHSVLDEVEGSSRVVRLRPGERLNRDFVLRYRLGSDEVRSSLALRPDSTGNEGTFLLMLVPPHLPEKIKARDLVFVLDRSGSMDGWKMVAARRSVMRMIETLTEFDRFTILAFDHTIETPKLFDGDALMRANDRRRFQATEWLQTVESCGGTEMAQPLLRASELLGDRTPDREKILVLITDGQVGNEDQILRELGKSAEGLRIFTLGIDRAVNAGFLKRLGDIGGGASEVVESEERLEEVMTNVHRKIGTPILTNVRLEGQGFTLDEKNVAPTRIPDLFAGTPVTILGRFRGEPEGSITIHGVDSAGRPVRLATTGRVRSDMRLGSLWAKGRVRDLEDRYVITSNRELQEEIVRLSLRFGVLCRFTAFVAVDRSEIVNEGGQTHDITQPVEQVSGWQQQAISTGKMRKEFSRGGRLRSAPKSAMEPMAEAAPPAPPAGKPEKAEPADNIGDGRLGEALSPAEREGLLSELGLEKSFEDTGIDETVTDAEEAERDEVDAAFDDDDGSSKRRMKLGEHRYRSGFWSGVRSLFGWGDDSGDTDDSGTSLRSIVERMRATPENADERRRVLSEVVEPLREFVSTARKVNAGEPLLNRLGEVIERIEKASPTLSDEETNSLWTTLLTILEGFVPTGEGQPRSGEPEFWK